MNMLGNHHQNSGGHSNFWRIRHDMIYSTKNGYAGTGQATRRGFQVPTGEFIRPTYRLVGIHQLQLVAGCNQGTSLHLPNMNMAMSWVILPFFRSEVLVPFELLLVINHYTQLGIESIRYFSILVAGPDLSFATLTFSLRSFGSMDAAYDALEGAREGREGLVCWVLANIDGFYDIGGYNGYNQPIPRF